MTPEQAKAIGDFLIADFEHEMQTTLKVLAAVPADQVLDRSGPDPTHTHARRLAAQQHRQWFLRFLAGVARNLRHFDPGRGACLLQGESSHRSGPRSRPLARTTGRHHRLLRNDAIARGQPSSVNDQALRPPPWPAQRVSPLHGGPGAQHLRFERGQVNDALEGLARLPGREITSPPGQVGLPNGRVGRLFART